MKDELIGYAKKTRAHRLVGHTHNLPCANGITCKMASTCTMGIGGFFLYYVLRLLCSLYFSSEGNPKGFVRFYMVGTFLKLLIFLGVIIFFGLIKPDFAWVSLSTSLSFIWYLQFLKWHFCIIVLKKTNRVFVFYFYLYFRAPFY